mmetsp:Transcript_2329/g.6290  ORF Transcript_2329/g.6290 Transcript_2329/m.6290 type:complete len:141 (-) Transcript_2329:131-553(-)
MWSELLSENAGKATNPWLLNENAPGHETWTSRMLLPVNRSLAMMQHTRRPTRRQVFKYLLHTDHVHARSVGGEGAAPRADFSRQKAVYSGSFFSLFPKTRDLRSTSLALRALSSTWMKRSFSPRVGTVYRVGIEALADRW